MKEKLADRYVDFGFGFPVVLLNLPMIQVRGIWTPNVNQKILKNKVVAHLSSYQGRLLGHHVRFLRLFLEMTLVKFADHLGVSHPSVLKWEKFGAKPSGMNWCTEKDIRLLAFSKVSRSSKDFLDLYKSFEIGALLEEPELVVKWK